jgi:hypothetical protein
VSTRNNGFRTLLRRLLHEADTLLHNGQAAAEAPYVEQAAPHPPATSPIRPIPPPATAGILPAELGSQANTAAAPAPAAPAQPSGEPHSEARVEDRLQAEEALEQIRLQTAQIANEFADGNINRAQFTALYTHYSEKRTIIERLLARDPDSSVWQTVARPGFTGFLRQHFEARLLTYTIYDNRVKNPDDFIVSSGPIQPPAKSFGPLLQALAMLHRAGTHKGIFRPLRRPAQDGKWVGIIPGQFTAALVLFSLEPSTQQFERAVDIHRDFERANYQTLQSGIRLPEQLVFPHRVLFQATED